MAERYNLAITKGVKSWLSRVIVMQKISFLSLWSCRVFQRKFSTAVECTANKWNKEAKRYSITLIMHSRN